MRACPPFMLPFVVIVVPWGGVAGSAENRSDLPAGEVEEGARGGRTGGAR
jgi:hypothetical protein